MADVTKIKLPDNSEYNLKDNRIPGVDTTPTSGSDNVVTSGGVYTAIENNELVIATALNDLNDRLSDIENTTIPTKVSDLENDSGFTSNTGTLTGVKFNNVDATVSTGVASITATIPAGLPSVSSSDNGKVLTVVSGDWAAATAASGTSGGVSDVTLGGTSVVSSGTAVLPAYPTVPTNVSSFANDANYVKYVLCNNEDAYNAISNKDSGTLYLIPVT